MKRARAYILCAAVLTLLAVIGAAAWILCTTEGAAWLLASVSRHTSAKISVRRMEGRLLDHLRLEGVRLALPQEEAQVGTLDIRWQPLFLLGGTLSVQELVVQNVRIQDNAPLVAKKEPVFVWPRVPASANLIEGSIDRLEVHDLTYRRLNQEPVRVTTLVTSVVWRETVLSLNELAAVSSLGRVAGNISAGFARPSLKTDLAITPPHPVAEMDLLFLHAKLHPGRGKKLLAGSVTISGRSGVQQRLELTGEVGMTGNAFNLRKLHLVAPGRRGVVTGEGSIVLTGQEPLLALQMKVANLDLAQELKRPTEISGDIALTGTSQRYRGHFDLSNSGKGWQTISAVADFQGNRSGMTFAPLTASLLDGAVQGNVAVAWTEGLSVKGALRGSNLNPARLAADWSGVANFELAGSAAWSKEVPLRGEVSGKLLDSRLHGQPLKGEVRATFADKNLIIRRLALQGKGFDLHASGQLDKRLDLAAHVSDLSRLVPGAAGEIRADGWLRWRERRAAGAVAAAGRDLAVDGVDISGMKLTAKLEAGEGYPVHVAATLSDVTYGALQTDSATLLADGTIRSHTLLMELHSTGAEARMELSGGYGEGTWSGKLIRFSGRDRVGPWKLQAPAAVVLGSGKMSVASLVITGLPPERLEMDGDMSGDPLRGSLRAEWHDLNVARANHWVQEAQFLGSSTGNIRLQLAPGGALSVAGTATATGTITADEHTIRIQRSSVSVDGGKEGIRASVELRQADGGTLSGTLSSSSPARLALPEEGKVDLKVTGIDLVLIRPWLPPGFEVQGTLAGGAAGKFLPGQRLELEGNAAVTRGRVRWEQPAGEINADLRSASASWNWRGETLSGTFGLALTDEGQARGSFKLPLPARLPVSFDAKGPVQVSLTGGVQEKGILTTLFPGLVQESHGELDVDVRVTGSWEDPRIAGVARLAKAGAYLPTAGIRAENVRLTAHLERDSIRIDPFEAVSGPGRISGTASIQLKGWQVAGYRGSIKGDAFRTVYFPELQVHSSPNLTFEGTPEKLVVRGEIRLPELLIFGPPTHNKSIEPSEDVVVEGMPPPVEKASPLALDAEVRVALGDRVLVKAEGIDAKLGGAMDLSLRSLDKITSKGEIKVVKGNYRTYGVNLQIVRGRIFYSGGPIRQPTLDILALRTIGEIRAGVTIAGTPQAPVIKLYSEPAMPDVDILAYVVLGHPLGSSSDDQAGLMAGAAAALLSAGQSVVLQDEIKNRLGLSTLALETTTGEATGRMGYKEIPVTPPGKGPAKQAAVSQTMLTVGKYLTPELYISYGRSLFTGGNLFRLRYDLSKRWQIQSETGSESGVDLYYKIDFK